MVRVCWFNMTIYKIQMYELLCLSVCCFYLECFSLVHFFLCTWEKSHRLYSESNKAPVHSTVRYKIYISPVIVLFWISRQKYLTSNCLRRWDESSLSSLKSMFWSAFNSIPQPYCRTLKASVSTNLTNSRKEIRQISIPSSLSKPLYEWMGRSLIDK